MEKTLKDSIKNYPKFDLQLNKSSFELTLNKIFEIKEKGSLDFSDNEKVIPKTQKIKAVKNSKQDKYSWWKLKKGVYKIELNEELNLPKKTSARIYSRKSLLQCGAFIPELYIEENYNGKIQGLLIIENQKGINIKENARVCKIVLNKRGLFSRFFG